MTDAWFENAIESSGIDGEGCRPSEALTLKAYLRNETTIAQTSHHLCLPTETCAFPGDPLLYLWGLLQDAMIELPFSAAKIVPLLLEMAKRPDVPLRKDQRTGALSDGRYVLWADLPGFANQWFDLVWWYYSSHWRCPSFPFLDDGAMANLPNIAGSDARLAVAGILGVRGKAEGLARLADTLEDKCAVLSVEMPVLKEWLLVASDMLFSMCRNGFEHYLLGNSRELRKKLVGRSRRELWEGESGASVSRWRFWKQRLGDIEEDMGYEEGIREAARVCCQVMARY